MLTDPNQYNQLREIVQTVLIQDGNRHKNETINGVNPYFRQTERGFYIEQYEGSLSILWTLWGQIDILGTGTKWRQEDVYSVLEKLGVETPYAPYRSADDNIIGMGPIYAVHKINGITLPDPIERPQNRLASYQEVISAWQRLAKDITQ